MKISSTIEGEAGRVEVIFEDPERGFGSQTPYCSIIDSVVGRAKEAYRVLTDGEKPMRMPIPVVNPEDAK